MFDLDVSIIVIAYNSAGRIGPAVRSHEAAFQRVTGEVIVVDNASSDDGAEEARAAMTSGTVIRNEDNRGYGKAANQGILAARGRTCIIMNDDARIGAADVERLLAVLDDNPRIGLVGPRIVGEDGEPMPSARTTFPGPDEEFSRIGDVVAGRNRNHEYPVDGHEPTDVAWLVGACVMGRTDELRRIGGFNPAFFLYVEDIDLCKRYSVLGYRVVTVPDAVCVHTGSVSTSDAFAETARMARRAEARALYYRIWHPRPTRMAVHLKRAIGRRNQPWRLRHHLAKALWDGPGAKEHRCPPPLTPDRESDGPPPAAP